MSEELEVNMFMGLDLSLTGSGLCIIDKDLNVIHEELIVTDNKFKNIEERLLFILNTISSKCLKYNPKMICIEGLSVMSKGQAVHELAGLHFLIRTSLYMTKYNFKIIEPTKLKKFITGKGQAKKNLMLLFCYKKFGVEYSDDNMCDAYCLARFGRDQHEN